MQTLHVSLYYCCCCCVSHSQGMQKMYRGCHLVHADLSEYNMLWHEGKVYFIDVGQSVEPSHPHGLEFLFRDCCNVSKFFSRSGCGGQVMSAQELFNFVTRMNIYEESDEAFLIQVCGVSKCLCCTCFMFLICLLTLSGPLYVYCIHLGTSLYYGHHSHFILYNLHRTGPHSREA